MFIQVVSKMTIKVVEKQKECHLLCKTLFVCIGVMSSESFLIINWTNKTFRHITQPGRKRKTLFGELCKTMQHRSRTGKEQREKLYTLVYEIAEMYYIRLRTKNDKLFRTYWKKWFQVERRKAIVLFAVLLNTKTPPPTKTKTGLNCQVYHCLYICFFVYGSKTNKSNNK